MGALATFVPWTPEDDLLLKNSVEAGASLESLAKGAVQFSRRYTVREIQDRWYSLLYDPIISAEASACMSHVEVSALPLPSKFSKSGHSKESKFASIKRKWEVVRCAYYTRCKRVHSDTCGSMNLNFLAGSENGNYVENGGEPLLENCILQVAASNHFGFEGSNFDSMHCTFPENMIDSSAAINGATAHAFYSGIENPVEQGFPINQEIIPKEEPHILGDKLSLNGGVEESGTAAELAVDSLIGDESLKQMPLSTFDHISNNPENLCSQFDGNPVFDSSDIECGTSFNELQLSPLPEMPIWRTDEGIEEPDISCDDFKSSIGCGEAYLAELSNSLLNFTNEEELYLMDVDRKDGLDKSYYDGLSSLLLNSANDVSPDQIPKITEADISLTAHAHVPNLSVPCHAEVENNMGSCSSNGQIVNKSEVQMPSSALTKDPRFPELVNGVICCTLNTEDPEIPCNDDVFLPFDAPPSSAPCFSKWNYEEAHKPNSSLAEDFGYSHRTNERGTILMQAEPRNHRESHASSHMMGSPPLLESFTGSKVKYELSSGHVSHTAPRNAVTVCGGLGRTNLANTSTNGLVHANPKEEASDITLAKNSSNDLTNSFNRKPAHGSYRNHHHPHASGMKQEQDVAMPIQDHQLLCAEMGSSDVVGSMLAANPPTSDHEEQFIESDDDVPYFSDIEAMVLDMDLDPDDQDLCCCEEVSRYQHEGTKRSIIRLEQGAHSYVQRAIALHGAFAILYGRHSRHYIKKPEVLLGRAAGDVVVDIDLGRERCANKISRRQAVIKMDNDGSFYLKNLGKGSILVNNKEVNAGQSQKLLSNCLIEIREIPFIFEMNQSRVKSYLDNIPENN